MKNVLILANGDMAKHFVKWLGKSRIYSNQYYINCCQEDKECLLTMIDNINYIDVDPTSHLRIKTLMEEVEFSTIFIVLEDKLEAEFTYKNIRFIDKKIFIVFVSKWDDLSLDDDNVNVVNINEVVASSLYENLPNVPLIAKNIGLGQGEIMEMLIPLGSSFAFRHVGAISHRKWKIVAIYRKGKQIFPSNNTMIQTNDRLIVIGNPLVLEEVYKRVNRRQGVFPEPFGKNLYLLLDMNQKREEIFSQLNEAIFLSNKLVKTKLFIRVVNVLTMENVKELRTLQTPNIQLFVTYNNGHILQDIDFDISQYEIGLFILTQRMFKQSSYKSYIGSFNRPIYLFGKERLFNIDKAVLLMGEEKEMESLSTSVFDISESLKLELNLCDYNPEGDFDETRKIVNHYETLSRLYSFNVKIEKKRVNPIKALLAQDAVLHIAPHNKEISALPWLKFFSTQLSKHILSIKKHPLLLIPVEDKI